MVLEKVEPKSSGLYKCEVRTIEPVVKIKSASRRIVVGKMAY